MYIHYFTASFGGVLSSFCGSWEAMLSLVIRTQTLSSFDEELATTAQRAFSYKDKCTLTSASRWT